MLDKVGSVTEEEPLDQDLLQELETIFSSLSCLNGSLLSADHYGCRGSNPGVDLAAWRAAFATIGRCAHDTVPSLVLSGLLAAMEQLRVSPPDVEALRFYLVLPLHPVMREPANAKEFHIPFAERLLRLQGPALKVGQRYPVQYNTIQFRQYFFSSLFTDRKLSVLRIWAFFFFYPWIRDG
jgi:E3 ubiquitin-protein ligase HERC4